MYLVIVRLLPTVEFVVLSENSEYLTPSAVFSIPALMPPNDLVFAAQGVTNFYRYGMWIQHTLPFNPVKPEVDGPVQSRVISINFKIGR